MSMNLKPEVILDKALHHLGSGFNKWLKGEHKLWQRFTSWFEKEIRK